MDEKEFKFEEMKVIIGIGKDNSQIVCTIVKSGCNMLVVGPLSLCAISQRMSGEGLSLHI